MASQYSTKQEGIDYYYLIVRHIDRMSEGLKEGLDVGTVNTKSLVCYYQQILHLESLLVPFLPWKEYKQKREKIERDLPGYSSTWSGDIEDQVKFFIEVSKLFRLLMVYAYNARVLKVKIRKEWKSGKDDLFT